MQDTLLSTFVKPTADRLLNAPATPFTSTAAGAPPKKEVAERAYFIYLNEGRPQGKDLQHWFQAEAESLDFRLEPDAESEIFQAGHNETIATVICMQLLFHKRFQDNGSRPDWQ